MSNFFGTGKSTVSVIVREVTKTISVVMADDYIKLPTTERDVKELAAKFFEVYGFSQCLGAIDGTHVAIKRPSENATDFINRKDKHTLNIQSVADWKYCFMDVVIKWSDSVHDTRIFSTSSLNEKFRNGHIPPCPNVFVDGEDPVPVCILGDPAYPLLPFLRKEFSNGGKKMHRSSFMDTDYHQCAWL